MTDLVAARRRQHRHEDVVARFKRRVGVHVDDLQREAMLLLQRGDRSDHVIAQMTVGAAVEDEMDGTCRGGPVLALIR